MSALVQLARTIREFDAIYGRGAALREAMWFYATASLAALLAIALIALAGEG